MELRYIITRAVALILLIVVGLYVIGFWKKRQRENALVAELQSLSSESSFFRQFYAEDARKSLVRAVALIAEGGRMGIDPERMIDRGLGIERKYFAMAEDRKEPPIRERIIRNTLRANFENFRKLGYEADAMTLLSFREGVLPILPTGPLAGSRPEVVPIIDPALSPGLDTVVANLEIRPPRQPHTPLTDIEIALAKRLAMDLAQAGVIETSAERRIVERLSELEMEQVDEIPE